LTISFFRDHDVPIQIYPAVHQLERLLSHWFTVDIEDDLVSEYSKVKLVPLSIKHFRLFPGQCLQFTIVVQDGKLNGISSRVQPNCKLWLACSICYPNQLPPGVGWDPVTKGGDEAELFRQTLVENSQGWHH